MLDDIREWISDNLRYILLVLAGLVVLFILVSGIRLITGGSSSKNKKEQTAQTSQAETDTSSSAAEAENTPSAPMAESQDQNLITLVQSYYQALAAQDVETVRVLTDQLPEDDKAKIEECKDIESFADISVYSLPGLQEGTWVVYAKYSCKYRNFATVVPGLSQLYVCTADDGSYYISNGTMEESVREYIEAQQDNGDVKALMQSVQTEHDAALAADTALAGYLQNKGQSASNALYEADGTELTVKTNCNVRAQATTSSEKLGKLAAGTKVVKEGSEAEWIRITYEGQTAYVRWDMFE